MFFGLTGLMLVRPILQLLQTPVELLNYAQDYLTVILAGMPAVYFYNLGAALLRSVGKFSTALMFLIGAVSFNIVADCFLIEVFQWGIRGAAIATVAAQGLSVVLVYWKMIREDTVYRVDWRAIRIDRHYLRQIIAIGLPSGIQNAVVSLSNVVVQSNINSFGEIAMAGCGAYSKLDGFALLPSGSFSLALSTFVSQNIGAKEYERAKKGAAFGLVATMVISELAGAFIYFAAPNLIGFFNSDPEVIRYGVMMARNIVFAYALVAYSHGMAGVLRGAGLSRVPMFVMVGCWCVLRVIWIQLMVPLTQDIRVVFWSYPITWTFSVLILTVYFFKVDWLHKGQLH